MTEAATMMPIPEVSDADLAFGGTKHMPAFKSLPEEFQERRGPYCHAVSMWFFKGAERSGKCIKIDGAMFAPREGVDADDALRAIRAVLGSFEPKHEHKIAACGFMLSQWFEIEPA